MIRSGVLDPRHAVMIVLWLLVAVAGTAQEQEQEQPTELEPMVVTPPFRDESARRLDRIGRQLPDPGQGGTVRKGFWERLAEYHALHSDPNDLSPEQQRLLLRLLDE